MRIALRTGGGRGVYELAGRQADMHASDLFGREICYELTPDIIFSGRAVADTRQGKPRIKLNDQQRTTHLYRLLAAVLLLPKPKRELKSIHGADLLRSGSYSMTAIKVDVGNVTDDSVVLRPTDLLLENADNLQEEINFAARMARIIQIWNAAESENFKNDWLAVLIKKLRESILSKDPNYKTIEESAREIFNYLKADTDILQQIEHHFKVTEEMARYPYATSQRSTRPSDFGLDDNISPIEARLEQIKQWREVAIRGSTGRQFRDSVRTAYDSCCLFSGSRLPKIEVTESAGVDAAHILPWSTHGINAVSNGLCLNKLCHWAFDAGILRFSFDKTCSSYVLDIPYKVEHAAQKVNFDLDYFHKICGIIPQSRLPSNTNLWPSPNYLKELNRIVFGG